MRVLAKHEAKVELDLINKKILYLLSVNARFSYTTIAKQVRLSREAVKQRIQRLIERKVLLGFQALIDTKKLGFSSYHAFFQLNNPQKEVEQAIAQKLTQDGNINTLIQYHGKFDFEVSYLLKDLNELNQKLKELSSENVKNHEVCFLLNTIISKTYPRCMYNFEG